MLRWVYHASGPGRKWIVSLGMLRILQGLEGTLFAIELRNVIDCAIGGDRNGFLFHLSVLCVLVLSAVLIHVAGWYGLQKSQALLEKHFRMRVFSQLLRCSYSSVSKVHSGEWMTRITRDVDAIVGTLLNVLPRLVGIVVQITSALWSLFILFPQAAFILLPAAAIMMLLSVLMRKRLKASYKAVTEADGSARSFMQERLAGLDVIRTFTQETQTNTQAEHYMDRLVKLRLRRSRFAAICDFGAYSAMRVGYLLGVVFCGFQILNGTMSYGTMAAVLQLVNRIDGPITELSEFVMKYFEMLASAERLKEIEMLPLDLQQPPHELEKVRSYYAHQFKAVGLRGASFSYDGSEEHLVVKNFSLAVRKGEFVAFTGKSGCGKSTVLKLLMGLYPLCGGELCLWDCNGDAQPLDSAWRTLFAYVPQGNHLLSGTLREVITFGDPARMEDDDGIWQALKVACADEFVAQLDAGLDTVLGECGAGLSEGQAQRLAIARAAFSGRPILMLDESTSALDELTERRVLTNLRTMTDRTVILVTHRPAALSVCDRQISFWLEKDFRTRGGWSG